MGFDLVPLSPLNSVQMPANANGGRSSFRANHTTSFFLVSGFVSGAYSAKLFAGTRQRFSGLSQARQCGDDVFLMLVTDFPNELTPRSDHRSPGFPDALPWLR